MACPSKSEMNFYVHSSGNDFGALYFMTNSEMIRSTLDTDTYFELPVISNYQINKSKNSYETLDELYIFWIEPSYMAKYRDEFLSGKLSKKALKDKIEQVLYYD